MNLQIQFGSAADTAVSIPIKCHIPLLIPIWATIIVISSSPRRTVLAATIARLSLPSQTARDGAKNMLSIPTRQSLKRYSALLASKCLARFELGMLYAARRYNSAMQSLAWFRAIRVNHEASREFAGYGLPAVRTFFGHCRFTCCISTCQRTKFLIAVVSWRHKVISALFTCDRLAKATRFIRARDRAEMVYSIFSFWNRLAATFTIDGFHSTIIQTNDGGV